MKNHTCLFCQIVSKKIPADIVAENDNAIAFKDIHPQAPTHLLIIPKKHMNDVSTVSDIDIWWSLLSLMQTIVQQENLSDFRIISNTGKGAGQSVFHLHIHLLSGRKMKWPPG